MKAVIRTLLALPLLAILILGAGMYRYDALHWSWYALAGAWLGLIALAELIVSLEYSDNPPADHR